jgi:predicted Zn-ribbon and HTH transcriptional regulator
MRRREINIKILRESPRPFTAEDIIAALGSEDLKLKDVYEQLKHVAKTMKDRGMLLVVALPCCRSCGFTFKDLDKLNP